MVPSLPLLSCESSVSVKKTLTEEKKMQTTQWEEFLSLAFRIQPTFDNGGFAARLKTFIIDEFFTWLNDNDDRAEWYNAESKTTATEIEVTVNHRCGTTCKKLSVLSFDAFRNRLVTKTERFITGHGSNCS